MGRTAAVMDAADHVGASLGGLLAGTLIVPIAGQRVTAQVVALAALVPACLLALDMVLARAGTRAGRRVVVVEIQSGGVTADLSGSSSSMASIVVESRGARVSIDGSGDKGNRARAAALLGLTREGLRDKLKRYKMD